MVALRRLMIVLAAIVTSAVLLLVALLGAAWQSSDERQEDLAAFYAPPDPLPSAPGTLLRSEPLGVSVEHGTAYRILYVSQRPDGTAAASGAELFVPSGPAATGGRPVVAWAHGTVGQGDACAPSRSANPLQDSQNWLEQMLALGWVVVGTDYTGLGTPGPNLYLVAQAEVRDLVNAVRAARAFPGADAGSRWVAWGHSQGGHAALWAGHLAERLAPELSLLGVAAAAPAALLPPIVAAQWSRVVGWVIGPEVSVSWPVVYPAVTTSGVVSGTGVDAYQRLAEECLRPAGIEGLVRERFGQTFFAVNPLTDPAWRAAIEAETVPGLDPAMPVFVAQGTSDEVVLPGPNAALQQQWCAAGARLTMLWMGGVDHLAAATTAGPEAVAWINDRFAGRPAGRTCSTPPPVPAT